MVKIRLGSYAFSYLASGDGTPNHNDEKVSTQFHIVQYYTYFKEYDGQVINGYDVIIIKLRDPVLFDEFRKPLLVCDETPNGKQKAMKAVGLGYTNSTGRVRPTNLQVNFET